MPYRDRLKDLTDDQLREEAQGKARAVAESGWTDGSRRAWYVLMDEFERRGLGSEPWAIYQRAKQAERERQQGEQLKAKAMREQA